MDFYKDIIHEWITPCPPFAYISAGQRKISPLSHKSLSIFVYFDKTDCILLEIFGDSLSF